jgi:hypothetical protein
VPAHAVTCDQAGEMGFGARRFVTEKPIDKTFKWVPVTDFAMDVWLAQHGWEMWPYWRQAAKEVVMASVSDDLPPQPEGGEPLYTVPIHNLGGMRALTIGIEVTASFVKLLLTSSRWRC